MNWLAAFEFGAGLSACIVTFVAVWLGLGAIERGFGLRAALCVCLIGLVAGLSLLVGWFA